jgi:hypothetical protein
MMPYILLVARKRRVLLNDSHNINIAVKAYSETCDTMKGK